MRIRMSTGLSTGIRGLAGTTALIAASALALTGCGDAGADTAADERPAAATATPSSSSPTPEASPGTESPTPTPTPTPTAVTLSDHTGRSIGSAVIMAKKAGLDYTVLLQGTGKRASSWGAGEKVCEQTDGADGVTFTVPRDGRDCDGRPLYTPKPTPAPEPARTRDTGSGGSGGSGGTGSGTGACELTSPAGNCYADGQFCARKHRGLSTHGRGGEYLTCARDSGGTWRWSDGVSG
ncbi:hypothetical protein [Streptomyces sp. YIM B13518]|uniref:hypothetical protein n=1 Tax=Streptomyces sp. YIM B13518 TaxID=3366316 RepID=UPI0036BAEA63